MTAWTLQKAAAVADPAPGRPLVCRSYGELLLHLRMQWHASPHSVFEIEIPQGADPEAVKALRRRGCVVRYQTERDHARRVLRHSVQ